MSVVEKPRPLTRKATHAFTKKNTPAKKLESVNKAICFVCAAISIATTIGIVFVLFKETFVFFQDPRVTLTEFLTGTKWSPQFLDKHFGVLPLVNGTLLITAGAMLIAMPLGLLTAIYLTQYASRKARSIFKPIIELLAGIPTVVYGYFGLLHVTPLLRNFFPSVEVYNAASGAIIVGIMVLPMITTLCDDALATVPRSMKEGGLALGSTKSEVVSKVLVRAALSGIIASFILAVSRVVGETMAVTLAAGQNPKMTLNPAESIQTMTAYIVQVSKGDIPAGSTEYLTLYAVGALLFVITMGLNILARKVVRKYRIAV